VHCWEKKFPFPEGSERLLPFEEASSRKCKEIGMDFTLMTFRRLCPFFF
jgi:hypothetical protein